MITIVENPTSWDSLIERAEVGSSSLVRDRVAQIIEKVRRGGDQALKELIEEIDCAQIENLEVTPEEIAQARENIGEELALAIETARLNIEKFHSAQRFSPIEVETSQGVVCSQRAVGIARVGLYIPGGSAPLFSTVLMLAIPARVAQCKEIILCTPPSKTGKVANEILYAASVCGVSKIYKVGGSQAIAAMAWGTETINRVDKIFGPGNRYVTEAKQQLGGSVVAIDMPAGPSEVMILADHTSCAAFVASDMLSQAEHGADSQAIAVCHSMELAQAVTSELEAQLSELSRSEIAEKALLNSKIIVFDELDKMVDFANAYAAEHLIISMENPWDIAARITAAGSIFIGNYTPESAGDYASGTNHTLPTSAWARSMSGVNLDSFTRKITYQEITREGLQGLSQTIITMAQSEGLDAHAMAVKVRIKQ